MAQQAACRFSIRGNVAQQLSTIRVRRFGGIELLVSSLYAIQNRTQIDVPCERCTAVSMQVANRGADLVIGVTGDVFHKKIDQSGIPLENLKKLKGPVTDLHYRCRRRNDRRFCFDKTELDGHILG